MHNHQVSQAFEVRMCSYSSWVSMSKLMLICGLVEKNTRIKYLSISKAEHESDDKNVVPVNPRLLLLFTWKKEYEVLTV